MTKKLPSDLLREVESAIANQTLMSNSCQLIEGKQNFSSIAKDYLTTAEEQNYAVSLLVNIFPQYK